MEGIGEHGDSVFFKYDRIPKMAVTAAILKIFKRDLLPNHMSD